MDPRHLRGVPALDVEAGGALEGMETIAGIFPQLRSIIVRMVQRGEHSFLPPFDDITLKAGDTVVIAATRQALADLLKAHPEMFHGHIDDSGSDESREICRSGSFCSYNIG